MFLKSLELQGFKSFSDKTVLAFDRGMSAVVGPNGSGKSNIADAIRWVLGEQSTKTLRGAKMEDVIFGGTEERGPVGFAEVSLILDNSDATLPISASEIMVTRRYFRSGESEYYINRATVRLRDIHELFMDTGIGRDGYSIIGQGRIDEILSVKSSDRREIFEEAAGISKFRYRKEEAERKLNGTEQNLVRINDKIAELELSVGPLKEQSETAQKYLLLRDELRVLEVSVWLSGIERLKISAEKVRSDFETVSTDLEKRNAELDAVYATAESLAEAMREKDIELEKQREILSETEDRLRRVSSETEVAEGRIKNLEENIARIQSEISEQSGREQSLSVQIAERETRAAEAEREVSEVEAEIGELGRLLVELSEQSDETSRRAEALELRIKEAESIAAQLKIELSSISASSAEMENRKVDIAAGISSRRETAAGFAAELSKKQLELAEAKDTAESLENVISGYDMRLKNRKSKFDAASAALQKRKIERGEAASRLKLLGDMEREYEGFSRAVKLVLQEHERGGLSGIHGHVAGLIKVENVYALAVETALGAGLQNIVVSTEENGRDAIAYLKKRDGGRATFLPLTSISSRPLDRNPSADSGFVGIASELVKTDAKYRGVIGSMLARTVIVTDMDAAIAMSRKYKNNFRIVTLDGQVINAGGAMTGGSAGRGTGILSRANEVEKLTASLATLDEELATEEKALREMTREITAAEYESEVALGELREEQEKILRSEGEAASLQSRIDGEKAAVKLLEAEMNAAETRLSDMAARTAEIENNIAEGDKLALELTSHLDALRGGLSEASEKRSGFSERMVELRERRSAAVAECDALKDSIAELLRMSEDFGTDRERREALIATYQAERAELSASTEGSRKLSSEIETECAAVRQVLQNLTNEKMKLEASRTAADKDAQERGRNILELERERGRLEQKKTEADMEERQLLDKLWENYELTPMTATNVAVEQESMAAANRKISATKREVTALGDVNIGAIEEYKRVSGRYEYLTTQRDDVEKSKRELEGIIDGITEKMREIFLVEFCRINESFAETFVEIFGGGTAQLRLEDEDDILGCGIEIRVQPPGKSLKTITLLSGGEKAFVAIALYFSILKVRPTPFCVLDEVDTALDDVNVARFAAYLKNLREKTQFIAITHKRGTMEECDVLYGVTMQSPGISKILALHISDVEEELGLRVD